MNWWAVLITVIIVGAIVTSGFWLPEKHPNEWKCLWCSKSLRKCKCK